jgi:hypothetical protein
MPIRDYPFTPVRRDFARPMLWIRVVNPTKNLAIIALAIIDTGADGCVFPAEAAIVLGHDLKRGTHKTMRTASGITDTYGHTSRVDILQMQKNGKYGNEILYTIPDTLIDFAVGCESFLLGCKQFLSHFILEVNYPRQVFSLRYPPKSTQ